MAHRTRPLRITPPLLSDHAAVDLLEFLHDLVAGFESHYFAQIHCFHDQRSARNLHRPDPPPLTDGDPY